MHLVHLLRVDEFRDSFIPGMARVFQRPDRAGWWVEYRDAEGRKRREKCRSKDTAQKLLARRLEEVDKRVKLGVGPCPPILFLEFCEIFLADHVAGMKDKVRPKVVIDCHLIPRFGNRWLTAITQADVDQYAAERRKLVKPATVARELNVLRKLLNCAVAWGYRDVPIRITLPKVSNRRLVFLEADEIRRLIDATTATYRPMVLLLIFTGLRLGEVLSLQWQDVDLARGLLTVVASKNDKGRTIPLPDGVLSVLRKLPRQGEHVFGTGKRYAQGILRKPLKRACEVAGITKPVTPHVLRHTYASQLVMAGVDLVTVAELLGHSSLAMVRRYAHLSEDHRINAARKLQAILDTPADTQNRHD